MWVRRMYNKYLSLETDDTTNTKPEYQHMTPSLKLHLSKYQSYREFLFLQLFEIGLVRVFAKHLETQKYSKNMFDILKDDVK